MRVPRTTGRTRRWLGWVVAAGLAFGSTPAAAAWGFTAHRLISHEAIATLPAPLVALFERNAAYLAEHSIDPDLWRAAGRDEEGPNHFLNLDAFGEYPFEELPRGLSQHLARHGAEAADHGLLPWRVGTSYEELVAAFRQADPALILERAAVLGHYVADAHVPLHAVVNYNGQLTGQHGVHHRWESGLVARFEQQLAAATQPAAARLIDDPVALTFQALLESFAASRELLAADRAFAGPVDLAGTREDEWYDDGYYSRFYALEAERLEERLASSASRLGSLWLSAWVEAGRPELDASFRFPYVRGESKLVLVSLDGAAATVIDDAVSRGVLPHLARVRRSGTKASGSLTTLPAKTAPGHAALFTGAWSDVNGIGGNAMALATEAATHGANGFSSTHLRAEPLWVTAARQGLDVAVVSATQVYPFDPFLGERRFGGNFGRRLTLFDGYQNLQARDAALTERELATRPATGWLGELPAHTGPARELVLGVEGVRIDGLLYDDPADLTEGLDTLYLSVGKDSRGGIALKATPAGEATASAFGGLVLPLAAGPAAVHFRLFELAPDASRLLLYRTPPYAVRGSRPETEKPCLEATGGFVGNGASWAYTRGQLGPPLWQGGDGTAERRYLETMALVARQFTRMTDFAWDRIAWDLLITYLPYPDELLHVWLGYLDPSLPGHDAALAARLQPFVDRGLSLVDGFVGHLAERAGAEVVLAVASDHGQVAVRRLLRPNVALREADLLALGADGEIDLARTRAVYFPGNAGYFVINRRERPAGIVAPEQEQAVREEITAVLGAIRDPDTGEPVVLELIDPRDEAREPRTGGPTGGDLYLSLAPGYYVSGDHRGDLISAESRPA